MKHANTWNFIWHGFQLWINIWNGNEAKSKFDYFHTFIYTCGQQAEFVEKTVCITKVLLNLHTVQGTIVLNYSSINKHITWSAEKASGNSILTSSSNRWPNINERCDRLDRVWSSAVERTGHRNGATGKDDMFPIHLRDLGKLCKLKYLY
jgi:hypothetical protein